MHKDKVLPVVLVSVAINQPNMLRITDIRLVRCMARPSMHQHVTVARCSVNNLSRFLMQLCSDRQLNTRSFVPRDCLSVSQSVCLSVCLSVLHTSARPAIMADPIEMPFDLCGPREPCTSRRCAHRRHLVNTTDRSVRRQCSLLLASLELLVCLRDSAE